MLGGNSGDLSEKLLESVWRGGGVRLVELTEKEQAFLAGFLLESADELEAIVVKVGGWPAFGLFLRGFGLGLGVWRNERASSLPGGKAE